MLLDDRDRLGNPGGRAARSETVTKVRRVIECAPPFSSSPLAYERGGGTEDWQKGLQLLFS